MKYKANYSANNGTTMMSPIEGNNKSQLLKDIKEIAMGNRFAGNTARWWVEDENKNRIYEYFCDRTGKVSKILD